MAKNNFNISTSSLSGSTNANVRELLKHYQVDAKFKGRFRIVRLLNKMVSALEKADRRKSEKQIRNLELEMAPVFILGHWRSGTTHLHNLMCTDPLAGFPTTYQSVFPNNLFAYQWLLKPVMQMAMPGKRPTDNVKLNPNYPQEEEMGLGNAMQHSFYHWWYFPKHMMELYKQYLVWETSTDQMQKEWEEGYHRFVKRSMLNLPGKKRFVSKNPPNTGRIPLLLKLYPNARFIYIYRNPYTVFESTRKFFTTTVKPLQLQAISDAELEANILKIYQGVMTKYETDKASIPAGRLYEVKFEDLEERQFETIEEIYSTLNLEGFEEMAPHLKTYLEKNQGYRKNKYQYKPDTIEKVNANWLHFVKLYGYEVLHPENNALQEQKP